MERTFSWLTAHRRLARDYEASPARSETMIRWAMIGIMLRQLTRQGPAKRSGPAPFAGSLLSRASQRRDGQRRTRLRLPRESNQFLWRLAPVPDRRDIGLRLPGPQQWGLLT